MGYTARPQAYAPSNRLKTKSVRGSESAFEQAAKCVTTWEAMKGRRKDFIVRRRSVSVHLARPADMTQLAPVTAAELPWRHS